MAEEPNTARNRLHIIELKTTTSYQHHRQKQENILKRYEFPIYIGKEDGRSNARSKPTQTHRKIPAKNTMSA